MNEIVVKLAENAQRAIEEANSLKRPPQESDILVAIARHDAELFKDMFGRHGETALKRVRSRVDNRGDDASIGKQIISHATMYAQQLEMPVTSYHLLKLLLQSPASSKVLEEAGVTESIIDMKISEVKELAMPTAIDAFCEDMLLTCVNIDPVIGRDSEMFRVIQILCRRTKNNPAMIGDPGVGKSAIAYGIAQKLVNEDVPKQIKGWAFFRLDLARLQAGAGMAGEFERRVIALLSELKEYNGKVILFIDEMHMMVGAGGQAGSQDLANLIKPALARGEMHLLGSTTLDEYRTHIEKDRALERRFQPVVVREPSPAETLDILNGIQQFYGEYHGVTFTTEALEKAVELAGRYLVSRMYPDKAIDLLDESAVYRSLMSTARKPRVTANDVCQVLSRWTGIPVTHMTIDERERLSHIEENLHRRLIAQESAVSAVSKAIRRNRTGLEQGARPIGAFLFLGPTGVGKTELAKTLAEYMFDDEKAMVRLDMGEYQEQHAMAKLFGAPPGYVGYGEGGHLTEPIRRRPYSVVLLDEIEKAHSNVSHALLSILDDGRMQDGMGHLVDFTNTIIIMTSNIAPELWQLRNVSRKEIEKALLDKFAPEFINRLDDLAVFHHLDKKNLIQIAELRLKELVQQAQERSITITFGEGVGEWLVNKDYNPEFGARPLNRTITEHVRDTLALEFAAGNVREKSSVSFVLSEDGLTYTID